MVSGLRKLINGSSSSYAFEISTSPYVILHPVELFFNTLNAYNRGIADACGIDLIRARILYEKTLRDITESGIKPIFIYNGLRTQSYIYLKCRAKRNLKSEQHFSKDKIDVPASQYRLGEDFSPFPRIFTLQCLQSLGLSAIQTDFNWMPACFGHSFLHGLPYFGHGLRTPESLKSLTINDLKLVNLIDGKFYLVENDHGEITVKLNVYQPDKSPLKHVSAASRPLIALLMHQGIFPKLPEVIKVEPKVVESFGEASLRSVIDYVSKTNPMYILKEIMEASASSGCADYLSETILSYLEQFCPDFSEASRILTYLGLGQRLPLIKATPSNREHQEPSRSSIAFFESAAKLLKGLAHEYKSLDIFYRWPKALIHLYRCGSLGHIFINPLYDKWGALFSSVNEYLVELPHCFGPSRILRYIFYCLIAGIDEANGAQFKLVGLKPHARELCYEGMFRFKMCNIHIQPLYLPDNCSCDDFLFTILGFNRVSDVPEWSLALIFTTLLWHQQKVEHKNCQINECPLILSTILLAIVAYQTPESDMPALANHLDELKTVVMSELASKSASPSSALEKEFLHGALELMALYDHYISLSHVLTALQTPNALPDLRSPIYNRFPQIHTVFPSLKLLVDIACHLKTQQSPFSVAQRMWLVKAFRPVLGDFSSVQALKDAVCTFSSLMRIIQSTTLVFDEPTVDVTDPPGMFLSRTERTLVHDSSCRMNYVPIKQQKGASGKIPSGNSKKGRIGGYKRVSHKQESYADRLSKRLQKMHLGSP